MQRSEIEKEPRTSENLFMVCITVQVCTMEYQLDNSQCLS